MLKSPTKTIDFFLFSFNSIIFTLHVFNVSCLVHTNLGLLCLLGEFTLLLYNLPLCLWLIFFLLLSDINITIPTFLLMFAWYIFPYFKILTYVYFYIYLRWVSFFFFNFFFIFFICGGFCHTLKWNSQGFTCVPHPNPPSHLPIHPFPLGFPSAPGPNTCLMHPTWAGDLFHPR